MTTEVYRRKSRRPGCKTKPSVRLAGRGKKGRPSRLTISLDALEKASLTPGDYVLT